MRDKVKNIYKAMLQSEADKHNYYFVTLGDNLARINVDPETIQVYNFESFAQKELGELIDASHS